MEETTINVRVAATAENEAAAVQLVRERLEGPEQPGKRLIEILDIEVELI
jgi:hypothetical protein